MKAKHSGNGKIIYVGKKCVVCCSESRMVAGDSRVPFLHQGRILLQKSDCSDQLQVEVKEGPSYRLESLRKGGREDTTPLTDELGNAAPEVLLLMALLTDSPLERIQALPNFMAQRQSMATQVMERLKKVIPAYEVESLSALAWPQDEGDAESSYPVILDLEPELFRHFVGQWMSIAVEENRINQLLAWERAAQRQIEMPARLRRAVKPTNQVEDRASAEHPRVYAAIKQAVIDCAGLPNQKMIRDCIKKDGGKDIKESVRGYLGTLGFSWIPGEPEWKKLWVPKRPKGWN